MLLLELALGVHLPYIVVRAIVLLRGNALGRDEVVELEAAAATAAPAAPAARSALAHLLSRLAAQKRGLHGAAAAAALLQR